MMIVAYLFSPPHPLTRPDPELLAEHFNTLNLEDMIEKALNGIDRKSFYYKKEIKTIGRSNNILLTQLLYPG
jgi:hypothetical protein